MAFIKKNDYVYAFPNWNKYPMSKMSIVMTCDDNTVSIGGGTFRIDLIRHTKEEALLAMHELRNAEIMRLLNLKFIHPKMKNEIE